MGDLATTVAVDPLPCEAPSSSEKKLKFWASHLREAQPATLPYDKPKPAVFSGGADIQTFDIDDDVFQLLQNFCHMYDTNLFTVLVSAFRAAHFRLTGQSDAIVGCLPSYQNECESQNVAVTLADLQPVRISVEGESLKDLANQVRETITKASANSIPLETIISGTQHGNGSSPSHITQIMFALHSHRGERPPRAKSVGKDWLPTHPFDLEFHISKYGERMQGEVFLSKDLYDSTTNRTMLSTFLSILERGLREPETPIYLLPLLSDSQYSDLESMGLLRIQPAEYARDHSIVDAFREQVELHPDRVAVRDSSDEMNYAELNRKSDIVASWLSRRSLAPETLIGIFGNRSCQTIVAFLGILKANLAYLPLNTTMPSHSIETILSSLDGNTLILTGSDTPLPHLKCENIKHIGIEETLRDDAEGAISLGTANYITTSPSSRSLAYVMFTSGSTGKPKGVMVEHGSVIRLAKCNHILREIPAKATMAHISNLAFDASTWEIYTTILNGGSLICIDTISLLDDATLTGIFTREKVQVAFFTTALFKQYIHQCPEIISSLDAVVFGGERLDPHDFYVSQKWMTGRSMHAYGPTENTGFIPLGVVGELILTGDGLARGYTDYQQNEGRFITVTVGETTMRAYRTGDYARHRPSDGQLEFWGRIDGQIKIRGHRVETGEIEHVLRSHSAVNNAIVVPHHDSNQVAHLLAFVTLSQAKPSTQFSPMNGSADDQKAEESRVWEDMFDDDTYNSIQSIQPDKIGRDFTGWTSMYDGSEIDKAEMNEWLDDTLQTITNGHPPGNVIELGSGTGMILFNLVSAPDFKSYLGLDPSREAVEFVTRSAQSIPSLENKVRVYKGSAADVGRLDITSSLNLAIINSVAQYFPSQEYLFEVIESLLQLEGLKTIFCGDIRSYALYQQFQVTKSLYTLGQSPTKDELREYISGRESVELELLVDPSFFTSLLTRLPHLVEHVEVLPKFMDATNELSCYRYAAIIHAKPRNSDHIKIHNIPSNHWIDFVGRGLNPDALLELLRAAPAGSVIAVSNIPHSKTILERHILDSLHRNDCDHDDRDWLSTVHKNANDCPSLSALELKSLAKQAGYRVEVSWARQYSQLGGFDAVFHKYEHHNGSDRVMFKFPTDEWANRLDSLSTQPWKQHLKEKVQEELYQSLRLKLPAYMVPQAINIMDKIPLNQNGKIDRRALVTKARVFPKDLSSKRQPETETERLVQRIWGEVLNIDSDLIGLDDSFFHLGGSSIAAMKVVSQAREAGLELMVAEIFSYPKLQDLCRRLRHANDTVNEFKPFSLIQGSCDLNQVLVDVSSHYNIDNTIIEDAYPCTPLQQGLISLTSKHSGKYVLQIKLELSTDICIDSFCRAWETVTEQFAVLRTRIVHHKSAGLLQLVLKERIHWIKATMLDEYLKIDRAKPMALGQPLTRYALVKDKDGRHRNFVWTIHHALFDGWSMNLIMNAVRQAFLGKKVEMALPFQSFIKYIYDQSDEKMTNYWRDSFSNCESVPFPTSGSLISKEPKADQTIEYSIPNIKLRSVGITDSSLIQAAWALVAGRMTNSSDVVFGVLQSGRNAPVADIDKMVCPTIATIPLRIKYSRDQKVSEYLHAVQQLSTGIIPFEQSGLHRIAKVSPEAQHACMFQTLLVIQPQEIHQEQDAMGTWEYHNQTHWFNTYAFLIEAQLGPEEIKITANFDSAFIKSGVVSRLLKQLEYTVNQLNSIDLSQMLSKIQITTPDDLQEIWKWNAEVPITIEAQIHDGIERYAQSHPNNPAICAWDGDFTYSELDSLATKLANHLQKLDIVPNSIIPICFEKSRWVTVSILGVLKAGCGFVLLDPFIPETRLHKIAAQVKSNLILSSISTRDLSSTMCPQVLTICPAFFEQINDETSELTSSGLKSGTIAYLVFTSGSTGEPKGLIISHTNYSSALYHQASHLGYSTRSRVYDFSSHSFDATIMNTFTTLTTGGCLCIPSDDDRKNNLAASVASLRANSLLVTPSLSLLLSPEMVPEIETIIMGGETCLIEHVAPWCGKVRVVNAYGPSECTPSSVLNTNISSHSESPSIGNGVGQVTWVVDPDDHNILLPPGCIGELLLEGPLIGQGYLNEPEKTAAVFIEPPTWLLQGGPGYPGRRGRVYKTGDLVRYHDDGCLSFIGRKDAQIKIRGQRVELEEIEHQIRKSVDVAVEVVAEVVFPDKENPSPILTAFVKLSNNQMSEASSAESLNGRLMTISAEVINTLSKHLPTYMIPRFFISVDRFPSNSSGKLDRKLLRNIGCSILAQSLAQSEPEIASKRQPRSETERLLQLIWAQVLKVEAKSIGLDDNFFQLGGDSIDAMRAVGDAYHAGLRITVADIFNNPKLLDLSSKATRLTNGNAKDIQPFTLINNYDTSSLINEIASQYHMDPCTIQDLYPCTPLQEGLLSMTLKRPGEYVNQSILKLSSHISLENFTCAWEEVVRQTPVLRTTVVHHNHFGMLQAVIKRGIEWIRTDSLDQHIRSDRSLVMSLSQPLTRYALVENNGGVWFVWTIHHALYDGWSMPLILDMINKAYHGEAFDTGAPVQEFVSHIQSQDAEKAAGYWSDTLADYSDMPYPNLPSSIKRPMANTVAEHHSTILKQRSSGTTTSTLIRAAWALVAAQMTHSNDVVFGATMSGRSLPVPGISSLVAPTITTVPIRIALSDSQNVSKYLNMVQQQATEMIPFEQTGLHRIAKISLGARRACAFQTLLVVQPHEDQNRPFADTLGSWQEVDQQQWFDTFALVIEVRPQNSAVAFTASFDSRVLDSWVVEKLLERLESVAHQLDTASPQNTIADIQTMTSTDLNDIWRWNATLPETSQQYVHEMIELRARSQPDSPAVCAWDGELTYSELLNLSSTLSTKLSNMGIGTGMFVPLCFEKSMWTSVAMIAVLRAGAAFILLDASLPEQRLQAIIKQSKAKMILSSHKNKDLSSRLCKETFIVDRGALVHSDDRTQPTHNPGLSSVAYAIFTSGTIGTPKGVVISHQNISSAIHHQIDHYGYGPESRVYDFSSYSFDPSIFSTLGTFVSGGCLCVPSDEDRRTRLADSISSLGANILDLTPTIARLLVPSDVPNVHTIILSGEMVHTKDVKSWWHKTRVLNLYGPAECTITSTMNTTASSPEEATHIGKGTGLLTWIVDPDDHDRLLPPGCTGELILEGPLVGSGYLDDLDRTAASFIEPPKWLIEGTLGESERHKRRLYKTGDLVQYTQDGSLKIIGRKDTQVKLRGQRVELAEVENGVQDCMQEAKQVIAEVIRSGGDEGSPVLVAFVKLDDDEAKHADPSLLLISLDVQTKLGERLPPYMIPAAFVSIQKIPLTPTGKTDRRRIRQICDQVKFATVTGESVNGLDYEANEREILDTEQPAYALAEKISSMCAVWAQEILRCSSGVSAIETKSYRNMQLHSCGLDSVSVMSLKYFVSQQFHVQVDIKHLVDRTTSIRDLARIVSTLQANGPSGGSVATGILESESVNLMAEVRKLDSKIAATQRATVLCTDASPHEKPLVVFLTGSTGFIGTQILRQLLEDGRVDTVIALARGETAGLARMRVIDAAQKALWWTEFHDDKLRVWQGDLSLPRLGLDPSHYSALSDGNLIDIIIHDGAVVHWGKDYRDLEAVNVSSTVTLLQHAVTSPHMRFVYVTGGRQWAPEGESEEDVAQDLSLGQINGYSQTKFVSEAVVRRAALRDTSRLGHVGIVSPGLVIGTSTEGVANSDDYIWRLALACIKLRAYNADMADAWLPVSDAATMASEIVNAALEPSKMVTCATIGMRWRDFWDVLECMGYALEPKTGAEWLAAIRADIEAEREAHPLWPLAHMIESQNTRPENEDGTGELQRNKPSIRLKVAVMRNVEFLAAVGFLPPLTSGMHSPKLDQHRGSFTRSSISV